MHEVLSKKTAHEAEYVIFYVGDQEYCIDIMSLREIRGWSTPTKLPDSPEYVTGIINLRGSVLPIIDLAKRLDLPSTEPTERSVVMITQIGEQIVGLLADAVSDILVIDENNIQAPPGLASDAAHSYVKGLVAIEDRMISLIALKNVVGLIQSEAA